MVKLIVEVLATPPTFTATAPLVAVAGTRAVIAVSDQVSGVATMVLCPENWLKNFSVLLP